MYLNNQKMKNHPPSPVTRGKQKITEDRYINIYISHNAAATHTRIRQCTQLELHQGTHI